jgi:polyferredoxin
MILLIRQKIRKLLLLISFLFFPITLFYFSPVLIIEGGFQGIIAGCFMVFAALFLFSLFFGRAFCGWICPGGGLQECCRLVTDKPVKGKRVKLIKYFIWAPWLITIIFGFITAGGIKRIDFFYNTDQGISVTGVQGYMIYLIVIALFVVLALTVGRHGACHVVCWISPFMVIGTKIKDKIGYPSLRLKADSAKCVNCGKCTKVCPMSLDVAKMVKGNQMQNSECILCATCIDSCKKGAIKFTFTKLK